MFEKKYGPNFSASSSEIISTKSGRDIENLIIFKELGFGSR